MPDARVLVIEDDEGARTFCATALRLDGFYVRTATDSMAAKQVLATFQPDLVIVDLGLPIGSGFEVLQDLRSSWHTQATPVIAMSAQSRGINLARANPDFFAALEKPFTGESLVETARRAMKYRNLHGR